MHAPAWVPVDVPARSIFTFHDQGVSHAGPRRNMRTHQPRPAASFAARSRRWTPNATGRESRDVQNAQRNYERYLALAQAEARNGNLIGAENYYQHAEHFSGPCRQTPERHRRGPLASRQRCPIAGGTARDGDGLLHCRGVPMIDQCSSAGGNPYPQGRDRHLADSRLERR